MSDETDLDDTLATVTPASRPQPTARPCPACGVFNPSERLVCRACGTDMETGEALPWPEAGAEPAAVQSGHGPSHPARWWLAVAVVLAIAGLSVLGLAVAELGPFARPPELPEASFDTSIYAGGPEDLLLSDVATATTLSARDGRTFEAASMVDDDPATAWRSDGLLHRQGPPLPMEIIDLNLEESAWISAIVIRNGDQIDARAYEDASRIQRIRAVVDGGRVYMLSLLDEGRGRQVVQFSEPVLTSELRLEVLEVFPGVAYEGIAVSHLQLRGWTATGDDVEIARERATLAPAGGQSFEVQSS